MVDGVLYSAQSDGNFQAQSFDGAALGAPTVINLNGLIDFPTELGTMTGLFYDRATARNYYTLAGNSNLYYRYFETQSGNPRCHPLHCLRRHYRIEFCRRPLDGS